MFKEPDQHFNRANEILNGEESQTSVFVEAGFRKGSFIVDLQLVQTITEHGRQLITAHPILDATGITSVLGFAWHHQGEIKDGVLELYKWLKGKKPDAVMRIGESTELTIGENRKAVTNNIFNLYGDDAIRQGLSSLVKPLAGAQVDRISILKDGVEQASLDKSEVAYFNTEPLTELPTSPVLSGKREAALTVSKLSFTETSNWTFFEQGATVVAKIEDEKLF